MVFVWSNLVGGEPHHTLGQVALNDLLMVVLFAPLVGLLLGVASITVPWATLVLSVLLYIVAPVVVAQLWRRSLLAAGPRALDSALGRLQPISLLSLLATLVLLFGFQGEQILAQPTVIAILAVPILVQVYFNAGLAWIERGHNPDATPLDFYRDAALLAAKQCIDRQAEPRPTGWPLSHPEPTIATRASNPHRRSFARIGIYDQGKVAFTSRSPDLRRSYQLDLTRPGILPFEPSSRSVMRLSPVNW